MDGCDDSDGCPGSKRRCGARSPGWSPGGEGGLSLGSTILTIDARYVLGLQNIDDSPDVDNVDVKTRGFELTLGAGWRVGG